MAYVIFCDRTTDKELYDSPINHKLLNRNYPFNKTTSVNE